MVTQPVDIDAEIAEALEVPNEELVALQRHDSGIDGMGITYAVADPDKASWRPAWRLEVGRDGVEYGRPIKLPKNVNALAIYLKKRRGSDGGRLFTLNMPARIAPGGKFECFANPELCRKKVDSKGKLIDHIEAFHPTEARWYAKHIEQIRESIAAENPALQATIARIAATPDDEPLIVPEPLRAEYDATLPVIPEPEATSFTPEQLDCKACGWLNERNTEAGLNIHKRLHCKMKGG